MPFIDIKYLFECETCRHYDAESKKCKGGSFFCDSGESYSPRMSKIPLARVEKIVDATWEVVGGCVEDGSVEMRCSKCGYTTVFTEEGDVHIRCPYCGAFMNLMRRENEMYDGGAE